MKSEKILLSISILVAALFMILLPLFHPYPLSFILKIVPLISLSILVILKTDGKERILILLALIFCMIGDILLDLDRKNNLKLALVAFLTGHVFYVIVFQLKRRIDKAKIPYIAAIITYAITLGIILRNTDPEFLIPVYAYIIVITAMTISAFTMKDFFWETAIGAVIFMFSDTIVAINQFLQAIPNSTVYNISLYFIAQILIIRGLTKGKKKALPS